MIQLYMILKQFRSVEAKLTAVPLQINDIWH